MTLFLLPNLLGPHEDHTLFLPKSVDETVGKLDGLIAESEKEARYFLRRFLPREKWVSLPLALLNEHTSLQEIDTLLKPLLKGEKWGLISDCGLPCLADPGALLVSHAHKFSINVIALPGPSSIIMALMLSGFSGQRFTFHGYIAKEEIERKKELKKWEKRAQEEKETQIFMEAPYRNLATFQSCLATLSDTSKLCVAWNLTAPDQGLRSFSLKDWKKQEIPPLHKVPALFLIEK